MPKYESAIDNDDDIPLLITDETDSEAELDMRLYTNIDPLSPHHLACHLPKVAGCPGCDMGKTTKSHSRRKTRPKVSVTSADSTERPFGAMIHMDHIAMEKTPTHHELLGTG